MSFINYMAREINCKIVYYGPGLCGKTTNLQYIYERTNPDDWFAMLVDGHVAYIARLGLPLNRQVSVRIGKDALSKAEADRCIDAVRRQGGR